MIFLTGGTGFLGRHLLIALMKQGSSIRALKRKGSRIPQTPVSAGMVEWVEGDILDVSLLEEQMDGCTAVYHCAGLISFSGSDRELLMKVNAEGTANVVNVALAKKIHKLVYASSVAAIGRPVGSALINESAEWDFHAKHTNYGISKYLAEREVWRGIAEGLNAVIVNPSIIIGEGNWMEGTPRFFHNCWTGFPYYTAGSAGFVAARDVAALMVLLMNSTVSSERFIINSENLTYEEFLFGIADSLGRKRPSIKVSALLARILVYAEAIRCVFTQEAPVVTKETARIAGVDSHFDAAKIIASTGYKFMPVKECIEATARIFLAERAVNKSND